MNSASATFDRIGVLGAGAWGVALAQVAARAGRTVTLYARDPALARAMAETRENAAYLPGVEILATIHPTADLAALAAQDLILAAVPAQHMRASLAALEPHRAPEAPVVLCAKGVEQGSLKLMAEVLAEIAPAAPAAILSGPGFAHDVARGLPTATTIASRDPALGRAIAETLGQPAFRPYWTDDVTGAEIGGAVKNVAAIACGIAEGRNLGDGARAALITRAFAEMSRLGAALGARAETLAGLSGLGDLVLTCVSRASRNTSLGVALGQGMSVGQALAGRRTVAEGAATAPAIVALAARHGVEMPICAAVEAVLAARLTVEAAIEALLARPFRSEQP